MLSYITTTYHYIPVEAAEGRTTGMAGTERMEWHQTHGNHVLDVFDTIPLILLQSLPRALLVCSTLYVEYAHTVHIQKHHN